jgi:hypothetical protein
MPEIWLKYGSTEVVLDIKAENLLDYVVEDEQRLSDEQINAKLDSITLGSAHIAVLDPSLHTAKLSLLLVESIKRHGIEHVSLDVPSQIVNMYRSIFQDNIHVGKLSSDMTALNNSILLSKTTFDPLFGYCGVPTYLLRYFGNGAMLDAYKARNDDLPRPGVAGNALSIAHKFAEKVDAISIEAVMSGHGFADIIMNKPVESHKEAIAKLESMGKVETERGKAAIISSGNGYSALSYALSSLWNCLDVVREDGSVTLLAECKDGFGSQALQMLVEGKIRMEDAYKPAEYIDGLENLLYLNEISKKYNISLVSALPDYYVKGRLGLKAFRRTKDALHNILNAYGTKQKVLVVSDASKVLLKPKVPN